MRGVCSECVCAIVEACSVVVAAICRLSQVTSTSAAAQLRVSSVGSNGRPSCGAWVTTTAVTSAGSYTTESTRSPRRTDAADDHASLALMSALKGTPLPSSKATTSPSASRLPLLPPRFPALFAPFLPPRPLSEALPLRGFAKAFRSRKRLFSSGSSQGRCRVRAPSEIVRELSSSCRTMQRGEAADSSTCSHIEIADVWRKAARDAAWAACRQGSPAAGGSALTRRLRRPDAARAVLDTCAEKCLAATSSAPDG
eukprot:6174605-Pleurochrysis_carterae.AAC.1